MKVLDEHEIASLLVILRIENTPAVRRDRDPDAHGVLDR
jgi:hypothetical protein